jgi:threonine dehydrogenase-like Zn-dependent dehydrogenase
MSPFTCSCGSCFYCSRGLTARCDHSQLFGWVEQGKGLHGAQAQYIRVPLAASTLVPIPDEIDDETALLLGDILSTGYFCADNAEISQYKSKNNDKNKLENYKFDSWDRGQGPIVAVVGCGPVGLIAGAAARHLGAKTVIALDSVPERLDLAEKHYGAKTININIKNSPATATVPASLNEKDKDSSTPHSSCSNTAVVELIQSMTEGRGVDCVLEAVGLPAAFQLATELVRPGGVVSVAGCHSEAVLPMQTVYNKNMTIKSGRCSARHFMDILLPLLVKSSRVGNNSKRVGENGGGGDGCLDGEGFFMDLKPLITHWLPLTPEAYKLFVSKKDGVVKVVMNPWLDS